MVRRFSIRTGIAAGAIAAATVLWLCPGSGTSEAERSSGSQTIPALDHPLNSTEVRNQFLQLAATGWPAMQTSTARTQDSTPVSEEKTRFATWVGAWVAKEWQPKDFAEVPYVAGVGLVHVRETADYRLRVREVLKPARPGSAIMRRAYAVVVEPLRGDMRVPRTDDELVGLVSGFIVPAVGPGLEEQEVPARWHRQRATDGGRFMYMTPEGNLHLPPVVLYAWVEKRILLIALYEDIHLREDPAPVQRDPEKSTPGKEKGTDSRRNEPEGESQGNRSEGRP
ncbi:MAG: hypothetical protein HY321_06330 [Armatimonadetes bacterium]|nr:hypothetical protein [Armatimonadota bacterium]